MAKYLPHKIYLITKILWMFSLNSIVLVGCGRPSLDSDAKSAMEPHVPRKGPWFEGWYARTTDLDGRRSLAVIVGSFVPAGVMPQKGQTFPGYIGVLYSDGDGKPTQSWSAFPQKTGAAVDGQPVAADPAIWRREDAPFVWQAPGYGSFENNRLEVTLPGQVAVTMEFGKHSPWDERGLPLGPESVGVGLPLPLHWYVGSLSSPTRYRIRQWNADGSQREETGQSLTHLEKNWGTAFPQAWNWLQGLSVDGDAQMVVGGGTLNIVGANISAWLAGYRSPKESWNLRFSDPGVRLNVHEDFCQGVFHMTAKRLDLEIEIKAHAPKGSFGPVAVPTREGFVADFGMESFSTQIEVLTYRPSLTGRRLTDQRIFRNAALEFGAGSYRKNCSRNL